MSTNTSKIDTIISAFQLIKNNSSSILQQHLKKREETENPLTKIILEQLDSVDGKELSSSLPQLITAIQKLDTDSLWNWLLDNKNFQEWLCPIDKYVVENIVVENHEKKYIFYRMPENHKEVKDTIGFTFYSFLDFGASGFFNKLKEDNYSHLSKIYNLVPEKNRTKLINDLFEKTFHQMSKDTLNSVFTLIQIGMEHGDLSKQEADNLFTTIILQNESSNSCLMPDSKVDAILIALDKGINLNYKMINDFYKPEKEFDFAIMGRKHEVFAKIACTNPQFDFDFWLNPQNINRGGNLQKYKIDNVQKDIREYLTIEQIKANKLKIEEIIDKENPSKPDEQHKSFKL